jgi:hypothetical protein
MATQNMNQESCTIEEEKVPSGDEPQRPMIFAESETPKETISPSFQKEESELEKANL